MRDPVGADSAMRLLDPAALGRIGRLELIARGAVEGFV